MHLHVQPRGLLEAMSPPTREAYLYTRNTELSRPQNPTREKAFHNGAALEHKFVAAGGLLIAGLDPTGDGGTLPGFGDQREVELLVDSAGFTPLEAIKIATLNGATYMGKQSTIGSKRKHPKHRYRGDVDGQVRSHGAQLHRSRHWKQKP